VEIPHERLSLEIENLKFQMDRTRVRSLPKVDLEASAGSVVIRQHSITKPAKARRMT
jgi:hypothetical protein